MATAQRLKWIRQKNGFAAYPAGFDHLRRNASIWQNTERTDSWCWTVKWEAWFSASGIAESKQEAADAATEAWWISVASPIPRDVERESAVLVARAPVLPPPNSLFSKDREFWSG